jgi:hypothetical protein
MAVVCSKCGEEFMDGTSLRRHNVVVHGRQRERRAEKRQLPPEDMASSACLHLEQPVVQHASKSARSARDMETERHADTCAASTSTAMKPADEDLQEEEIGRLVYWEEKMARSTLDDVKKATVELAHMRAVHLCGWLEERLLAAGVTDTSTLEEITAEICKHSQPWQGMESEKKEKQVRAVHFPHIQPKRRQLLLRQGKTKYAKTAGQDQFCYDLPVEERLQQLLLQRPEEYHRCREFLRQQKQKQEDAVVDGDWIVDDYYTALHGLAHPRLGKSDSHLGATPPTHTHRHCTKFLTCGIIGFASYGDGIDVVKNALGIFANHKSVVVFILVFLFLPPAERLQLHNLHIATVALSCDCKAFGYDVVVGGNPADLECTSMGGSMRRFDLGVTLHTPDPQEPIWEVTGEIYAVKGDNPQVSALLATKESFGSGVKSPCDQCYVGGESMNDVDWNKSFVTPQNTPFEVKTSKKNAAHVAEINSFTGSNAARDKLAQKYGMNLSASQQTAMHTAYHTVPHFKDACHDARTVEVAHDGLLGTWPQQVHMNLFFYTRDKSNPNYFGLERLQRQYSAYDWKGANRCEQAFFECSALMVCVLRNDIPPQFSSFPGRNSVAGKELYGDKYVKGMPVPHLAESFKWTAAMSFTFLIHAVALLSPLIKDHNEPMWVNFKLHQRFLLGLLQWSASVDQITRIDLQIRQHGQGMCEIWQFKPLYKYKNHALCHAAHNFLHVVPPRPGWALKGV